MVKCLSVYLPFSSLLLRVYMVGDIADGSVRKQKAPRVRGPKLCEAGSDCS